MDQETRAQHPVLRPIDDKELARESWKIFQIMGEFVEGFERLARIRPSVSIFGSARTPRDHPLYLLTVEIARKLVELLKTEEVRLAEEIRNDDDRIDQLHLSVFDKVLGETWKGAAVDTVDATLASRYHERFADHAVSIAKKVQYLATGDWVVSES